MKVKVNITNNQRQVSVPIGTRLLIRRACAATLIEENFEGSAQVDVTFVSDDQIRIYNKEFRNIDNSTDVLSFPLGSDGDYDTNPENGAKMLGDVVISLEHAVAQANLYGHSLEREIAFLTVHSVLHLLGYDHVDGGLEQMRMREKEESVLEKLGLAINKI